MADTERHLTYADAVRIREEVLLLQEQLGRIIAEARNGADGDQPRSTAKIARDLQFTEGRIRQILRSQQDTETQ